MTKKQVIIINDDCINQIENFKTKEFDIILTSPPYNLGKNNYHSLNKYNSKYENDNDIVENYKSWLKNIILKYLDKCEYFFLNVMITSKTKKIFIELLYELKDYYCDTIIGNKNNGTPNGLNKRVMTMCFEYVYVFSKGNNSRSIGTKQGNGTVKNICNINGNQKNKYSKIHRATFPKQFSDGIIENFVKKNGKVLDIFGGIGTTMGSCVDKNIDCVMIEKNKLYCDIAKKEILNYEN